MSYCRFSSDGWRSEVYVYEDVNGGWTTHVAGRKHVHPRGELCPMLPNDWTTEDFMRVYEASRAWLDECELVDIGLPHDGESFNDPTPNACAERLLALQKLGYYVPQHAIDELLAEAAEP